MATVVVTVAVVREGMIVVGSKVLGTSGEWKKTKYKTKSYHANKRETQMIQIINTQAYLGLTLTGLHRLSGTKLAVPHGSCHFFCSLLFPAPTQSKNLERCLRISRLFVTCRVKFKMTRIHLFTESFKKCDMQ